MNSNNLQSDVLYEDMRLLLYQTVHKFISRYGGEWDEVLSESHVHFMQAYKTYNPEIAKFTTWLVFSVWHGLLISFVRPKKKQWRKTQLTSNNKLDELPSSYRNLFWMMETMDSLSADARIITSMLLDLPSSVLLGASEKGDGRITPTRVRTALQKHLRELGWTMRQIHKAFDEIRRVIRT